jgi:hypothetical protein
MWSERFQHTVTYERVLSPAALSAPETTAASAKATLVAARNPL